MLVVEISSLLANQMFAYAACKTLALDKGYEFAFFHKEIDKGMGSYHSKDTKYGRNIYTIFSIPDNEKLTSKPSGLKIHRESDYRKDSNFYPEFFSVEDNTLMIGHFISPKFFWNRRNSVKEWFDFPNEIKEKVDNIFNDYKDKKLVSVHFRVGDDYRNYGYLLDSSYWNNAAKRALELWGDNILFVVFYDKKNNAVKKFLKNHNSVEIHGSLVEDLYAMTLCDSHIISNSSYSIMGAVLDRNDARNVIRPSIYPISHKQNQADSFIDSWEIVEAKRAFIGFCCSFCRIGKIRNKIINLMSNKST